MGRRGDKKIAASPYHTITASLKKKEQAIEMKMSNDKLQCQFGIWI